LFDCPTGAQENSDLIGWVVDNASDHWRLFPGGSR
jgi:hypothetical protein